MQSKLPLGAVSGATTLIAAGACLDFEKGSISPMHYGTVAELLGRLDRRAPAQSLRAENRATELFHGVLTALAAQELLDLVDLEVVHLHREMSCGDRPVDSMDTSVIARSVVGTYGALHSSGRIFSGSYPMQLPARVLSVVLEYEESCSVSVRTGLGLPSPSFFVGRIASLGSLFADLLEMQGPVLETGPLFGYLLTRLYQELREFGYEGSPESLMERGLEMWDRELVIEPGNFPRHAELVRHFKRLVRGERVQILSLDGVLCGAIGPADLPAGERLEAFEEWLSGLGPVDTIHRTSHLRRYGLVEAIPVRPVVQEAS